MGATVAANAGVQDRLFKRHGRWKSESAKDGYVKDSAQRRLEISKSLAYYNSTLSLYIYVVVCLFVAGVHNDAKPIWCWLIGGAVLGAGGGRYTILSVEHRELDRNYAPFVCDWLYST